MNWNIIIQHDSVTIIILRIELINFNRFTNFMSSSSEKKDLETSSANRHSPSVHVANKSLMFSSKTNSGSKSLS